MFSLLTQIPRLFQGKPEPSVLAIEKADDNYSLSIIDQNTTKTTQLTLEYFKDLVGTARLQKICQRPVIGIDLEKIDQNTLALTKKVLGKVLPGLLDVQKDDLDAITLDLSAVEKYKMLIGIDNFDDAQPALFSKKLNLKKFQYDICLSSGKGLIGLKERVFLTLHHHFKVINETNRTTAELREGELLTSRLADREMQIGNVFHLNDGVFFVDEVFVGGGAYVAVLQDVDGLNAPKIVCRGTAMRPNATSNVLSGVNDVLLEIGTMGVKSIWPKLLNYIEEKKIKSIEMLGKSLGGAHAQELAILIEGLAKVKVNKLTTVGSVGVGKNINDLFKREILKNRETPFEIQVIRNGSLKKSNVDYIPAVGGVHLGEGTQPEKCRIDVTYIQPGTEEAGTYPLDINFYHLAKNFLGSFSNGHCRQTTLNDFSWKTLSGRDIIDQHLRVGNDLESIRKCLAYILHYSTFTLLNGVSFSSFFHHQKEAMQTKRVEENLPQLT